MVLKISILNVDDAGLRGGLLFSFVLYLIPSFNPALWIFKVLTVNTVAVGTIISISKTLAVKLDAVRVLAIAAFLGYLTQAFFLRQKYVGDLLLVKLVKNICIIFKVKAGKLNSSDFRFMLLRPENWRLKLSFLRVKLLEASRGVSGWNREVFESFVFLVLFVLNNRTCEFVILLS